MDKKEIQERRKKGYFIDAARKIISKKGVGKLTVKNIAERAGFAPGTMYNYFDDLNELLYFCAQDFWEECRVYVLNRMDNEKDFKEKVISFLKSYCQFFIDEPNIFELIFLKDFDEFEEELPESPQIAILFKKIIIEGGEEGFILEKDSNLVENILGSSVHGMLLFYIKKRSGKSKKELMEFIEEEIEYVLD